MKKNKTLFAGTLILMCFFVTTAFAQESLEAMKDGKKVIEASQLLIADGQVLQNCTGQDRVKMVDEGHMMIQKGRDVVSEGSMMHSSEGRSNMLEVGQAVIHCGNMLLKKGKQQGELTAKDIAKIKKLGKNMTGLGNLKLEEGKIMAGG